MPLADDVEGMLRWSLSPGAKPAGFLKRVADLRLKRERGAAARDGKPLAAGSAPPPPVVPPPELPDRDWVAFQAEHASSAPKDAAAQIQDLEHHLAFADFALKRARQRGDEHAQKKYADELIKWSRAVKEQRILADRLGVESGELLPRATVEAIVAAHAYWTMRATDMALDSLSRRLVNLSFAEEARAVLEPELLSMRFIAAYARAAQIDSASALPVWFVDAIRDTIDDFIEDGAAHFTAAIALEAQTDGSGI